MKRIQLTVAYDGTDYHGWQFQPGQKTIEGELNHCLSQLLQEEIKVIGASRTDTGVHGLCNIAVFDTGSSIPPEKFAYVLNGRLPSAIRIQESREVSASFHPRKVASKKTYEYRILNQPFPNPLETRYAHFMNLPLNVKRMQEGAEYLVGEHDFASFCASGSTAETTVRRIEKLQVVKEGKLIKIRVCGNGFLYHMVRIIAGTLMEVGKGKVAPWELERILLAKKRSKAGPTAPACGLVLVDYEFT